MFLLDSAGTVHPERWHYVTEFVIDIVEQLDVGPNRTRVSVIIWSDTAHVAFELNQLTSRQDIVQVGVLDSLATVHVVSCPLRTVAVIIFKDIRHFSLLTYFSVFSWWATGKVYSIVILRRHIQHN